MKLLFNSPFLADYLITPLPAVNIASLLITVYFKGNCLEKNIFILCSKIRVLGRNQKKPSKNENRDHRKNEVCLVCRGKKDNGHIKIKQHKQLTVRKQLSCSTKCLMSFRHKYSDSPLAFPQFKTPNADSVLGNEVNFQILHTVQKSSLLSIFKKKKKKKEDFNLGGMQGTEEVRNSSTTSGSRRKSSKRNKSFLLFCCSSVNFFRLTRTME